VPKLPASVRVGPFDYKVKLWSALAADNAGAYGMCDLHRTTILIREDMSETRVAEVLLHEVFHAAYEIAGLKVDKDDITEERFVNSMGYQMVQVWRDNPDLIRFMEEVFRPKASSRARKGNTTGKRR
jgi:hypothetical protein